MNAVQFLAVSLLMATTLAGAAESIEASALSVSDEALVRQLETKSWAAWKTHDAAFFEQFLADDHVEVHRYGITDKAAVIAGVRSPRASCRPILLDHSPLQRPQRTLCW
jgi:hypothetical protein